MENRKFRGNIAGRDRNIWGNIQIVTTTATGSNSKPKKLKEIRSEKNRHVRL